MKLRVANTLVAIGVLLNISVHDFGDYGVPFSNLTHIYGWGVFDYGNMISLLIISIGCMLISTGERFAATILATTVFLSLIYDAKYGVQFFVGRADIAFYTVGALLMVGYMLIKRLRFRKDADFFLMLSIPIIKAITCNIAYPNGRLVNIIYLGVKRSYFEMGNASVYLLLAIYFARPTYRKTAIIPLLFLVDAVNEFRDNFFGNPYEFKPGESLFMIIGVILVFAHAANRKYHFTDI